MVSVTETICRRCWWREGGACYNDSLMGPGLVNKMPRTVEGDDRNGMEITEGLWLACTRTSERFKRETEGKSDD